MTRTEECEEMNHQIYEYVDDTAKSSVGTY